jgi:hypothetical protein
MDYFFFKWIKRKGIFSERAYGFRRNLSSLKPLLIRRFRRNRAYEVGVKKEK